MKLGANRGLLGQRAGSDDGRHSFGSCCPEHVAVACWAPSGEVTYAPANPNLYRAILRSTTFLSRSAPKSPKVGSLVVWVG